MDTLHTDTCLLLAYIHLFPEKEQFVSKGAKMLSEIVSKQASSEITLFERYIHMHSPRLLSQFSFNTQSQG